MFWEIYQQSRINSANTTASRAESKALNVTHTLRHLEDKVDSLALTCQAMWEILRDRTSVTEEELIAKVNEIDLRDGKADGKMGSAGNPCSQCGRVLNKRRSQCIYCGNEGQKEHAFQQ
jgi:hypothetical protein